MEERYETKIKRLMKNNLFLSFQNDSSVVNVSVVNVNDWEPRFRYPQYEFFVSPSGTDDTSPLGQLVGRVEAADGDKGDSVSLSLTGTNDFFYYRIYYRITEFPIIVKIIFISSL